MGAKIMAQKDLFLVWPAEKKPSKILNIKKIVSYRLYFYLYGKF